MMSYDSKKTSCDFEIICVNQVAAGRGWTTNITAKIWMLFICAKRALSVHI